jgi:hypothetical protein
VEFLVKRKVSDTGRPVVNLQIPIPDSNMQLSNAARSRTRMHVMRTPRRNDGGADGSAAGQLAELRRQLRRHAMTGATLFRSMDANRSDSVTLSEFRRGLHDCGAGLSNVPPTTLLRPDAPPAFGLCGKAAVFYLR